MHPNLTFIPIVEDKNTINFLDLQLIRKSIGIERYIYIYIYIYTENQQPQILQSITPLTTPREHEMAAYR